MPGGRKSKEYDVYDHGELIAQRKTAREIADMIGVATKSVWNLAEFGTLVAGRYFISFSDDGSDYIDRFVSEWEEAVRPFKRVKWVKEMREGVKCLR